MLSFSLAIRSLLLVASFAGLCAALRVRFGLDPFIAPFSAACGIITVLMLGGMIGVLAPTAYALYLLGFAGLAYTCFIKRTSPHWYLLILLILFVGFLIWRFYFCPLWRNDDLSHWGLVARHLLRNDRFPRGGDDFIYFESYPLGTACFIYYIGKATIHTEGIYLVAQNLLLGLLYLPMFSLIYKRRRVFYPIAAALFFLLFHFFRYMINLQVDLVLAFFGIGMAAAIARYRDDFHKAMLAALPAMIAAVYVKNSGLFFSAVSAYLLYHAARRAKLRRPGCTALAAFALSVLAFLIWSVHLRLHFPSAASSKHALSLTAYASQFLSKGFPLIGAITARYLRSLIPHLSSQYIAFAFMVPAVALLFLGARRLPKADRRQVYREFAAAVAIYFIWYVLVLLMYIFSMPEDEALSLASYYRYNGTGLTLLMGMTAILLFDLLQRTNAFCTLLRWMSRFCPIFMAAIIALTAWPKASRSNRMFERSTQTYPLRAELQNARETLGLEDGDRFIAFWKSGNSTMEFAFYAYYGIKYEFETDDILLITTNIYNSDKYYYSNNREWLPLDDLVDCIAETIDDCDAFLILNEYPEFEAEIAPFLADYEGDTPVYRAF